MKTPTPSDCDELFNQYKVPGTVKEHCKTVHTVATFLAEELVKKKYPLRLEVVKPFSLLHDFMKVVVLERLTDPPYNYSPTPEEVIMHQKLRQQYQGMSETKVACLILKDNFPKFAQLFLELEELTRNPLAKVQEETHFIHYVDWRVMWDRIVSLTERMEYIYQRYGKWIRKHNINWILTKQEQLAYEQKIFKLLPFPAEKLQEKFYKAYTHG